MHAFSYPSFRTAGLLACAALGLAPLHAGAQEKDALPDFDNSITVGGQGSWAKGDKTAFEADQATAKNGFGGIEAFNYSTDLKNDYSLKSDGHALLNDNDYLAHLNIAKNEFGSVDIGYKRFRTYYDNAGGFFLPTSNAWAGLVPFPEQLFVDRSKFWAEVKLSLPDAPVFTLRYTNEVRSGRKDSTIWGASDYTGLTGLSNSTNFASRFIAPGYLELGEHHQKLEGQVAHTMGDTTLEFCLTGDRVDNVDTRYFDRYPGEIKMPVIASTPATQVLPVNIWRLNNEIYGFDRLHNESNTLTAAFKIETKATDAITLHAALNCSGLHSDFDQYRPLYTATPFPAASPIGFVDAYSANALNLVGGADVQTVSANFGADFKITPSLFVEAAVKGEDYYCRAFDFYQTLAAPTVSNAGVVTPATPVNMAGGSRTREKSLIPELSIRYNGIRSLSLYGTAEYKRVTGEERIFAQYNVTTVPTPLNNDVDENHGRYTLGANWAPLTLVTLRAETFYKDHHNDFDSMPGATTSIFVLGYQMKGVKLTATLKPTPTLTFTTRYVYQTGTMQTSTESLAAYQSMDRKSHNIGESIDWTPFKQLYMQVAANLVYDVTSTSYPSAGLSAASSGNNAVQNANNNYWNGSFLAGFVVDKMTNAELQCTYYKASNFDPLLIASGMPYGAGQRDYTVTVGLKRKITDKLIAEAKIGYLNSKNDATGGNTDYTARIAYVSLQQAF